jgi:hypothetical protein
MSNDRKLLFSNKDISSLVRLLESQVRQEIESWDRARVLGTSRHDLMAFVIDKFSLDPPKLNRDDRRLVEDRDAKIDISHRFDYGFRRGDEHRYVQGQRIVIGVKFTGAPELFEYQASTFTTSPPQARVVRDELHFVFEGVDLKGESISQAMESELNSIEKYLGWLADDCKKWNERLEILAAQIFDERRARVLQQANTVAALGLPMQRAATNATLIVPLERKKRPVILPQTPKDPFHPEPALSEVEYDYILQVIDRMATQVERSPTAFEGMKEEQIRDMLLVNLNGHYEGSATGETFNAQGKTDILIREKGGNAFIAECKFWEGAKGITRAVDQLLSYLTWRDTKASLVVFSKNVSFTDVLAELQSAIVAHPCFKKELRKVGETHMRYLFRLPQDENRDVYLATQAFNIPRKA